MSVTPARAEDVELATFMAREAAPIAMRWFASVDLDVRSKGDGSPVTQGDLEIEARLRQLLAEHDADASIVGEEEGHSRGQSPRTWFLDPIDGTTSFVHGVPLFGTLIALEDEHGPAVGVIGLPGTGELVVAGRGLGCTFNGKATRVSKHAELNGSLVTTWGFDAWPADRLTALQEHGVTMRGWSDAYGWALLASGRADAVLDTGVKVWDLAPMRVIVPEAGGRFSSFDGEDRIDAGTGMGSNGVLHEQLLGLTSGFAAR